VEAGTCRVLDVMFASRRKPTQEQLAFEADIDLTYMGELRGRA
jgi:hypothetical protein